MTEATFRKGAGLLELASVQRAIHDSSVYAGNEIARRLANGTTACIAYLLHGDQELESPLEAIFYAWFGAIESLEDQEIWTFGLEAQRTVTVANGQRYRFDFGVVFGAQRLSDLATWRGVPQPKLGIELDGHDFHERTKEQVAARNTRDRDLTAAGWTVLHYSGSELYRDPIACVAEVIAVGKTQHDVFRNAVYAAPVSEVEREMSRV